MKVQLSYSTINMLYESNHGWINKMLGVQKEDKDYFTEGKEVHSIIQAHVSGKKKHDLLADITEYFPVVEEKDRDERCLINYDINEKYELIGYVDGFNQDNKTFLEIKSSSVPWSIGKFLQNFQRKCYALALPDFEKALLITCKRNPQEWSKVPPKRILVPLTQKDREDALQWIMGGIEIIENGSFVGGLDENGRCVDSRCLYGNNCHFRSI